MKLPAFRPEEEFPAEKVALDRFVWAGAKLRESLGSPSARVLHEPVGEGFERSAPLQKRLGTGSLGDKLEGRVTSKKLITTRAA